MSETTSTQAIATGEPAPGTTPVDPAASTSIGPVVGNSGTTTTNEKSPSADPEIQKAIAEKLMKIAPEHYILTDVNYGFRSETVDKVNEKGETVKVKLPKRANVKLAIPFITFQGLVSGISEGDNAEKVRAWVISLVNDAVVAQGREQVSDSEKPVNLQSELDVSKLTMEAIALLPKSERGGAGISKETWEAFGKDYALVMVAQGVRPEAVGKAVDILVRKLVPVKTNKKALAKLAVYINTWYANSTQQEEFADVFEYLKGRADQYLTIDDEALAEAL